MHDEERDIEESRIEERPESAECDGAADFVRGASLLQEKWTLMIVHSLQAAPLSFCDLMRRGTVNTTTLTQRLHGLEEAGVLTKTVHSLMPPRTSYALTESGQALKPILDAVAAWSKAFLPAHKCPASQTTNES